MSSNTLLADAAPLLVADEARLPTALPTVGNTAGPATDPAPLGETLPADEAAAETPEAAEPTDDGAVAEAGSADATPPPAAAPSAAEAGSAPQLSPADTAALLKKLFPALFSGAPKPLKLRIQADIQERAPGRFSKQSLSGFFRRHTGSTSYLMALSRATQRFDLDGAPAGELSAEHRQLAAAELTRRRGLNDARRAEEARQRVEEEARHAEENAQRFNRATLLRAFETTTLTPANFCALKGIDLADLDVFIARARAEAAEAPTERRPDPRADVRSDVRPDAHRDGRRDARPDRHPDRRPDERGARPDNRPAGRDARDSRGGRGAPGDGRGRPAGGGGGGGSGGAGRR
jgi:sRNA-binding protein